MKPLYHFTSRYYLPAIIAAGGIDRGDVPLSESGSVNGAWLTSDGRRGRQAYNKASRFAGPDGRVCVHDKAEIRLTVDPEGLENFYPWAELVARLGIDPAFAAWLNRSGNESGDLWWVSLTKIPLERIVQIERDTNGNGSWREVSLPLDPVLFPLLRMVSVSSWEIETGQKISRVPAEQVIQFLQRSSSF